MLDGAYTKEYNKIKYLCREGYKYVSVQKE